MLIRFPNGAHVDHAQIIGIRPMGFYDRYGNGSIGPRVAIDCKSGAVLTCPFDAFEEAQAYADELATEVHRLSGEGETQATIGRWAKETFPGGDPKGPAKALRTLDEVIELCLAAGATPRQIYIRCTVGLGDKSDHADYSQPEKVPSEAADVDICLKAFAYDHEIDLQAETDSKMKVNRARRWKSNGDGTGQHVKSEPTP